MPQAVTYSEARQNLAETMDRVCYTHEPLIITRQKSRPVVMMSLEDYSSIAESAYLLQSTSNASRLRIALQDATSRNSPPHKQAYGLPMLLTWTPQGWDDYLYWQNTDKRMVKRINELVRDALHAPFEGLGKPEPSRFDFAGCWSQRIDREHRLAYRLNESSNALIVLQCRYHN